MSQIRPPPDLPHRAPYFRAWCECGWAGSACQTQSEAQAEAERHGLSVASRPRLPASYARLAQPPSPSAVPRTGPTDPHTGRSATSRHTAAVYDVRPSPTEPEPFEPYFIALCECGWVGDVCGTADEAFADARSHTEHVVPELQRLVG